MWVQVRRSLCIIVQNFVAVGSAVAETGSFCKMVASRHLGFIWCTLGPQTEYLVALIIVQNLIEIDEVASIIWMFSLKMHIHICKNRAFGDLNPWMGSIINNTLKGTSFQETRQMMHWSLRSVRPFLHSSPFRPTPLNLMLQNAFQLAKHSQKLPLHMWRSGPL